MGNTVKSKKITRIVSSIFFVQQHLGVSPSEFYLLLVVLQLVLRPYGFNYIIYL